MRYLMLAAVVALAACKAEETRGENDSIKASTGSALDSGAATSGIDTARASDTTKEGATKRP